jgi:hypothetical protein
MARLSKIDRMPAEVREMVGQLRREGATIDQILAKLREAEVSISRGALGNYTRRLDQVRQQLARTRGKVDEMLAMIGPVDDTIGRINVELMHGAIQSYLFNDDGTPRGLDPKTAAELSRALSMLAQAQKLDADRMVKIQATFARKADKAVARVARREGLSAEAISRIRAVILGLAPAPGDTKS